MSHCSQCGRYIGPYEACPYCGARLSGRISVRAVKRVAVGLATGGLFLLWWAATRAPLPRVQIGQAGTTMNLAYAQVEGWVVRGPEIYPGSGYLAFTVADETGEVRVAAYRQEAHALQVQGRVPALGDRVSVAGTLRVREEGVALTINVPEHVEVLRPEAVERQIGAITPADRLLRVRVRGQVWALRQPYPGLTLVTLRDPSGAVDVVVDRNLEALTGALLPLQVGQSLEVVGAVDLYRDTPQIVPASVRDVVPLSATVPVALPVSIAALNADHVGRLVAVEGVVTALDSFAAGDKLVLDDGSGEGTVFLWQDLARALPDRRALTVGAQARVVGQVALYRGELEVVPERALDVVVLAAAPTLARGAAEPVTPLSDLTAAQVGQTATVEGVVVEVASFASGFRFVLDDGGGRVVLLLWLPVYDTLPVPGQLDLGARVRATGVVGEYDGALQLSPPTGSAVAVLMPAAPPAAPCEMGVLSAADAGSLTTVEGAITAMEPFSAGWRITLSDGTGVVTLLVWDNIARRVAVWDQLTAGAWVRAAGIVELYRGALQVVPRLPHDVTMAAHR